MDRRYAGLGGRSCRCPRRELPESPRARSHVSFQPHFDGLALSLTLQAGDSDSWAHNNSRERLHPRRLERFTSLVALCLPPYSHEDALFGDPETRIAHAAEAAALVVASARTLRRLAVPEIFLWDVPPHVMGALTHLQIHAGGNCLTRLEALFAAAPRLEALDIRYKHKQHWHAIAAHPDALPRLHSLKLWCDASNDAEEEWGELAHTALVPFLTSKAHTLRRLQLCLGRTHQVEGRIIIEAIGKLQALEVLGYAPSGQFTEDTLTLLALQLPEKLRAFSLTNWDLPGEEKENFTPLVSALTVAQRIVS